MFDSILNCFEFIVFPIEPNWVGEMHIGVLKEILYTNCWYKLDFSHFFGVLDYTVKIPIYYILSLNCHLPLCILTYI